MRRGRVFGARRTKAVLAAAAAAVGISLGGHTGPLEAQGFPDRPLRLFVGQAPGTATDLVARAVAAKWGELLGQAIVVENRPGAGESLAADAVAKAAPDGYTILFGSIASHGIGPAINRKLPYDPARDFAPISMVGSVPNVLVVYPGLPAANVSEFFALVKASPGKWNYASTGVGTSTHLGMELLKARMAIDIVHVPYKAGGAAFTDLIAGQVSAGLFNLPSQLPLIKSGKVRALAVSSLKRSPHLPDVPTLDESGVPGYAVVVWYAVFAPAATPARVRERLHADLVKAIESADLRERLTGQLGVDPMTSTPDELGRFSQAEIKKWARVVEEAGVKVE
ncbi:MAG TPA: tripartite tricarboxylate transporter substrate binding protein [Burkholderiales bacterium]|nr:tripartite tricarboxylate transporter substrate binding protein [Burkholderiales bacterium]